MNETGDVDILALASLARIALGKDEALRMEEEVRGILGFVKAVQGAQVSGAREEDALRNVMREDAHAYAPGTYTETLLSAAPSRSGEHVKVKQVLGHVKKNVVEEE